MSSQRETSASIRTHEPPPASITASVGSPPSRGSRCTSETTTWAPSRAMRIAIARPSPEAEPVITATLPFRRWLEMA